MKGQYFCQIFIGLLGMVDTVALHAGPAEDIFGAGSRVQAMGGAGAAFSQDTSATFYNPALLTRCLKQNLSLGYQLAISSLTVQDNQEVEIPHKQMGFSQTTNLGVCLSFLDQFAVGFYASFPLRIPLKIPDIDTLNSTPQFLMYGENATFPSVIASFAYAPIKHLSLGLSMAFSAGVGIHQTMNMPIFASVISPHIYPLIQMIVGAAGNPTEALSLSLVYRQSGYGRFDVEVETKSTPISWLPSANLALQLGSVLGYSPEQIALGLSYQINPTWLLGADLTYYRWASASNFFLSAKSQRNTFISNRMTFPVEENLALRDTFVPRFGLECILNEKVKIRSGYAFHMSAVPLPSQMSNILDGNVHRATFGAGYRFLSLSNLSIIADFFVAVDVMFQKTVKKSKENVGPNNLRNYNFGGTAMSAGLTIKAEY
jgi:long-subunit fatty acid transport protein